MSSTFDVLSTYHSASSASPSEIENLPAGPNIISPSHLENRQSIASIWIAKVSTDAFWTGARIRGDHRSIKLHKVFDILKDQYHPQSNLLTFSPCHNPITAPVSPTQSLIPSTAALAMPVFLRFLLWPMLPFLSPVAYSEPILGSTFSPALKLTNSAKGTSHTHKPKYEAISVKLGCGTVVWYLSQTPFLSLLPAFLDGVGLEKC